MKAEEETPFSKLHQEYKTFNYHWDNYTPTERKTIIKDFQKRLYELG